MDSAQLSCVRMLCANLEQTCMRSCNFEDPGGTRANLEGEALECPEVAMGLRSMCI